MKQLFYKKNACKVEKSLDKLLGTNIKITEIIKHLIYIKIKLNNYKLSQSK